MSDRLEQLAQRLYESGASEEYFHAMTKQDCPVLDPERLLADAIIATLPSMVKPLVWDGAVSKLDSECYYTAITSRSGKSVCVDYVSRDASHHIGYYSTLEAAKSAAQAHYVTQIMQAFGLVQSEQ